MKNEVITSRENPAVRHIIRLGKSSAYRAECGEFVCEGQKMLEEAISSNARIKTVFYDGTRGIPHNLMRLIRGGNPSDGGQIRIIETDSRIISVMSSVETAQGIVFSAEIPTPSPLKLDRGLIILDDLRDPGNIGTIMRTADAFSFSEIALCGSCADIYNPKVVRSTMGAAFRINAVRTDAESIAAELKKKGMKLYASSLSDGCEDISRVDLKNSAVVIGNEARGVSDDFLRCCDGKVIIPMTGWAESLNASVAAGIFMWEMRR